MTSYNAGRSYLYSRRNVIGWKLSWQAMTQVEDLTLRITSVIYPPFRQDARYLNPFDGQQLAMVPRRQLLRCRKRSKSKMLAEGRGSTHVGNSPLHLAIYSLRIVPSMNSLETLLARSAERGMIIRPDVNLSRRLMADNKISRLFSDVLHATYYKLSYSRNHPWEFRLSCFENIYLRHGQAVEWDENY